jgi:hypothetical protein
MKQWLYRNILKRRNGQKRLYLHIGVPKTGTSAIQLMLFENEAALDRNHLLYPKATMQGPGDYTNAHHALAHAALNGDEAPWQVLRGEMDAAPAHDIVLSSEAFSNLRTLEHIEFLRRFIGDYQIKVIIYLRRQDEFLQALYQTMVTYGDLTCSFSEYYDELLRDDLSGGIIDYHRFIRDFWVGNFELHNLIIRVYEKQQLYKRNLLLDFLQCLDVPGKRPFKIDINPHSRSLNAYALELYRHIKLHFPDNEEILEAARRRLREENERAEFTGNNIIPTALARDLMTRLADSNRKVATEFMARTDGRLFRNDGDFPVEPASPPAGITKADIHDFLHDIGHEAVAAKLN